MKTHIGYIIGIAIALLLGYVVFSSWLAEHDQRVAAQAALPVLEARVKTLQDQMADREKQTSLTIAALQRQATQVKTPTQAIAAIPTVSNLPLNMRPAPDNPNQVIVDVVPLFQGLNQCKQDAVALAACQANVKDLGDIVTQREAEIVVLKKKPAFWSRVWSGTKKVGIGSLITLIVVGAVAH